MLDNTSTIAVPPGETIREQLEDRGMTQKEFAARMGMSEKHISNLINGKAELTHGAAMGLESVLGVPARFWNNLEAIYREALVREKQESEMDEDIVLSKKFPYLAASKEGWLPQVKGSSSKNAVEKVRNLRSFFEVSNLQLLCGGKLMIPGVSYRCLGHGAAVDYCLAVWSQRARLQARNINTEKVNLHQLEAMIPEFRAMTMQAPDVFCRELEKKCAACGVALVFLPHIGGSFLHGASFWDGNHIVLGLTVRGKDADKFWFSFFHEISHILLAHINSSPESVESQEADANNLAKESLIPADQFMRLKLLPQNEAAIRQFANEINVHPGIVVGRMQHEHLIEFSWFNSLKVKYQLVAA